MKRRLCSPQLISSKRKTNTKCNKLKPRSNNVSLSNIRTIIIRLANKHFSRIGILVNPGLILFFRPFHVAIQIELGKSIDVVLGVRTQGCRIVGATEL